MTIKASIALVAASILAYAASARGGEVEREPEAGFAIQSVLTGKNIRVYDARGDDGNRIVLYDAYDWKCMTWKMEKVEGDTYQLRNLLTRKSFQPGAAPKEGAALFQQPLKKEAVQQWEFLKQPSGTYRIRLKGTDLFVSTSSKETNSSIVLDKRRDDKSQEWKLIEQRPQI